MHMSGKWIGHLVNVGSMAQETDVMQVSEPKLLFCQIFTQTP